MTEATKQCSKCHVPKSTNLFQKSHNYCNECRNIERRKLCQKNSPTTKLCDTCHTTHSIYEFERGKMTCKSCIKIAYNQKLDEEKVKSSQNHNITSHPSKTCYRCGESKNLTEFYGQQCVRCLRDKKKKRINSNMSSFFKHLATTSKSSAKSRGDQGRTEASEYDITFENLQNIYQEQYGLCYYSGIALELKQQSDWQCSIERLDPKKGYVQNNIALICSEFQSSSQWTLDKFQEFKKLVMHPQQRQSIKWVHKKQRKVRTEVIRIVEDGIDKIKCTQCKEVKPSTDFLAKRSQCITCRSEIKKQQRSTPLGHIQVLYDHMKCHSKSRKHELPEFDVQELIKLFESQGGLCAYSGIPMTFGSYLDKWWTCSVEREDISIGYTKDNTKLICWEFNTPNRSARAKKQEHILGHSGWTPEKISFLKSYITEVPNGGPSRKMLQE